MDNKIDYDDLKYVVERSGAKKDSIEYNFNKIKDSMTLLKDISDGKISVEEATDKQENYYNYLKKIRKGNKSAVQKRTLANISVLFNARDNVIKYVEDYSSMILEAKKTGKRTRG